MKKLTAIILCAAMLLFAGCSAALSPSEYYSGLNTAWTDWVGSLTQLSLLISDENGGSASFDAVQQKSAEANAALDKMKEGSSEFKELSPPSEYKELHKSLLNALEKDEERISIFREILDAKTQEEYDAANARLQEYNEELIQQSDSSEEMTVPQAYLELVIRLDNDGVKLEGENG